MVELLRFAISLLGERRIRRIRRSVLRRSGQSGEIPFRVLDNRPGCRAVQRMVEKGSLGDDQPSEKGLFLGAGDHRRIVHRVRHAVNQVGGRL